MKYRYTPLEQHQITSFNEAALFIREDPYYIPMNQKVGMRVQGLNYDTEYVLDTEQSRYPDFGYVFEPRRRSYADGYNKVGRPTVKSFSGTEEQFRKVVHKSIDEEADKFIQLEHKKFDEEWTKRS